MKAASTHVLQYSKANRIYHVYLKKKKKNQIFFK